jgi:cephalosporin hydroxylase
MSKLRRALGLPLDYAGAALGVARIRRAPTAPAEALDFARTVHWPRGTHIVATQQRQEILELLDLLAQRTPRAVLEIGTDEGGTLFLWTRVAADDAVLVAVDDRPLGITGTLSPWAVARRAFARNGQRIELMIPRDSHDPATAAEARRRLGGRSVDFLFIDGDHSYDGVKCDWELFSPLVAPGGLVAFHDVNEQRHPDVVRFWDELKATHDTTELVANDPPGTFGIGVVHV